MNQTAKIVNFPKPLPRAAGFYVTPRSLHQSPAWIAASFVQRHVLNMIISLAEYKPVERAVGKRTITIQPGQLCITQAKLADECGSGLNRNMLKNALEFWKKRGVLTSETINFLDQNSNFSGPKADHNTRGRVSLLTICNYNEYTAAGSTENNATTHNWTKTSESLAHSLRTTVQEQVKEKDLKTLMSDSLNQTPPSKPAKPKLSEHVSEVFEYWKTVMGKTDRVVLDSSRKSKIIARLRDGHTVQQIKQAIDGCKASAFHMGQNDSRKVYNDIKLICRDASNLEGFAQSSSPAGNNFGVPQDRIDRIIAQLKSSGDELKQIGSGEKAVNIWADGRVQPVFGGRS